MDDQQFWEIIEQSRQKSEGQITEQAELIVETLYSLPADEILSFNAILDKYQQMAYSYDLWAVAYLAYDGCDDDSFEHFRSWLISFGRAKFLQFIDNADSAADLVLEVLPSEEPLYEASQILFAPAEAYEKKTGKQIYSAMSVSPMGKPRGVEFNERNIQQIYPSLHRKFEKRM